MTDVGQRVAALQSQIKTLTAEHIKEMLDKVDEGMKVADEVANGGDAYHPGIREAARKLVEDGSVLLDAIRAIAGRF